MERQTEAASEGPWEPVPHVHGSSGCHCLSYDDPVVGWSIDHRTALDCDDIVAARSDEGQTNGFRQALASCDNGPLLTFEDATFATKARTDMPRLLAEVRLLRDVLADAQTVFEYIKSVHPPIRGEGDSQWCEVCSQEEHQPQPTGWWIPWPCPTVVAVTRFLSRLTIDGEIADACARQQEPDGTGLTESDIDHMMNDAEPAEAVSLSTFQVWPLSRVLEEIRCGSKDWSWEEEWADLDRRHADTAYLTTLEKQIKTNGITDPVLIGSDGRLWDGHHRLRLAVRLGVGYVPVEVIPQISAEPLKDAR